MPQRPPKVQSFSRNRVIEGILEEILNAGPASLLQRAIASFGQEWEENNVPPSPVGDASNKLWNCMADLGLVCMTPDECPAWTEISAKVFIRLNFIEPKDIEKAMDESDGKVVAHPRRNGIETKEFVLVELPPET